MTKAVPRYAGMHHRVSRSRGKARDRACVFGGDHPAADWAWLHLGPQATVTVVKNGREVMLTYGLLIDTYVPVCRSDPSHHWRLDHGLVDNPLLLSSREVTA